MADSLLSSYSWYDRVPGPANIADAPSRLRFAELEAMGASRDLLPEDDDWLWASADEAVLAAEF